VLGHFPIPGRGFGALRGKRPHPAGQTLSHRPVESPFLFQKDVVLPSISTVAVMPATNLTSAGTWSIVTRTGTRCASLIQVKIGLT